MSERERRLQDELYRLIANLVRDKRFAGLTLSVQTELELPINSRTRRADVAVLKMPEEIPVLIVETKRKVDRVGHYRREERFDPYGNAVHLTSADFVESFLLPPTLQNHFPSFLAPHRGLAGEPSPRGLLRGGLEGEGRWTGPSLRREAGSSATPAPPGNRP